MFVLLLVGVPLVWVVLVWWRWRRRDLVCSCSWREGSEALGRVCGEVDDVR